MVDNFPGSDGKFQSTLLRRERPGVRFLIKDHNKFQSTLPRRERQVKRHDRTILGHFNPRSREGSDIEIADFDTITAQFQSTLP